MKKRVVKLSCVIALVLLAVVFTMPLNAAEPVIKLRYSNWFAPTHRTSVLTDQWCKEVEKRTNGRVKVTLFSGGTLSPPTQTYDSLVKGAFDVGTSLLSYTTGRFPLSDVLDMPLGYNSGYQATKMVNAYYKKFKPKELDDVKIMYLHAHGPTYIHTKKQIARVEDIKGLRIKSTGISSKIVTALGGTPVTMPLTETYDALSKGLADGLILHLEVLKTFKFGELLKCTVLDHGMSSTTTSFIAMNKKKWDSLPKDVQQIIEQINEEWIEKQAKVHALLDKDGEDYLIKSGNTMVKVSAADQAKTAAKMKPIFEEYVKATKAKGLPGDEALKFCQDFLKANP
jgi:TRAP-type C4-dicarboxylate transport system substrate-binding protein